MSETSQRIVLSLSPLITHQPISGRGHSSDQDQIPSAPPKPEVYRNHQSGNNQLYSGEIYIKIKRR
ncbi:hypothetical protein EBO34_08345 [Alteribacter keqinensis]|uniref:Uncharacterized protein n=1 Tax=Alteribacter keqinensis TaxID=2483800 RepID=A0A3M7TWI0_9BACI|nr:hypothetical protein EBO34_08345 [Alteribacter keqinensis]